MGFTVISTVFTGTRKSSTALTGAPAPVVVLHPPHGAPGEHDPPHQRLASRPEVVRAALLLLHLGLEGLEVDPEVRHAQPLVPVRQNGETWQGMVQWIPMIHGTQVQRGDNKKCSVKVKICSA